MSHFVLSWGSCKRTQDWEDNIHFGDIKLEERKVKEGSDPNLSGSYGSTQDS